MKKLLATALLLSAAVAQATNYMVVVPVPGRTARAPATPAVTVDLRSATLPDGAEGAAYAAYDFNQLLQVTGDPAFKSSSVAWSVAAGSLPAGITLSAGGVLAGTPTAAAVANFTVSAAYKDKSAQRAYQLVLKALADPYWNQVQYLFNFEGANGAKTLSEPVKGGAVTFYNSAQLVTSTYRFGQSSLSIVGGYVQLPGAMLGVGTADFTFETYLKANALGNGAIQVLDCRPVGANGSYAAGGMNPNGQVGWYVNSRDLALSGANAIADTNWHHFAYSRAQGVGRLFVDGKLVGSGADATNYVSSGGCIVGKNAFNVGQAGAYLDAMRVTAGVGRYTSDFVAPARPYPTN